MINNLIRNEAESGFSEMSVIACVDYAHLNELIYSFDRKIRQSVKQEHRGTITACAYRCRESTIIQFRGTIDYVVKTQHYGNKSCLVIKRTKTHRLH